MRRNVKIRVILNSLLLTILFSCNFVSARDRDNKKSVDLNSHTLPPECNDYNLVSGNLKTAGIIYINTSPDYPWYQDAVCAGKLISKNKQGSSLTAVTAHQPVTKREIFNERGMDESKEVSFLSYLCGVLGSCFYDGPTISNRIFINTESYPLPNPDDEKYNGLHVIVGNDPRFFSSCSGSASDGNSSKETACIKKREPDRMVFDVGPIR